MQSLLLCCLRHRTNETIIKEVFHLVNFLISQGVYALLFLYVAFSDSVLRFLTSVLHASIPSSCFQSLCTILHHCLLRSSVYFELSFHILEAPLSSFSSLLYLMSSYSSLNCQLSICSLLSLSLDYSPWYIPLIESGLYIQLHQCVNSLPQSIQTSLMRILHSCGEIGLEEQLDAPGMTLPLCQLFIHQLSTAESPIEYDVYCVYRYVQEHQVDSSSLWLMLENLSQTLSRWSIFSKLFHFVLIHFPPSSDATLVYLLDTIKRRNGCIESKTTSYLLSHSQYNHVNSCLATHFHFTSSTISLIAFIQLSPLDVAEEVTESHHKGPLCNELPNQWLLDVLDRGENEEELPENVKCQIRGVLRQFLQSSEISVLSPLHSLIKEHSEVARLCLVWVPSLPSLLVSHWDESAARILLETLARVCENEQV